MGRPRPASSPPLCRSVSLSSTPIRRSAVSRGLEAALAADCYPAAMPDDRARLLLIAQAVAEVLAEVRPQRRGGDCGAAAVVVAEVLNRIGVEADAVLGSAWWRDEATGQRIEPGPPQPTGRQIGHCWSVTGDGWLVDAYAEQGTRVVVQRAPVEGYEPVALVADLAHVGLDALTVDRLVVAALARLHSTDARRAAYA